MYDLPYFKEPDPKVLMQFIHDHPFALICGSNANGEPYATQIPVFLEEEGGRKFLRGHMMKNNDHHLAFSENPRVLVVFSGPHSYVSATWYTDPHQASTWNYMSVHARGEVRFLDDEALISVLRKTSLHFEGYNADVTTAFDNLPESYTRRLMKAIVAFEIEVLTLDHVFKLSQNRDEQSYTSIIRHLKQGDPGAQFIAKEMESRHSRLFPEGEQWDPEGFMS